MQRSDKLTVAAQDGMKKLDSLQEAFMQAIFAMPKGSYLCTDSTELTDFEFHPAPVQIAKNLGHRPLLADMWWSSVQWLIAHHFHVQVTDRNAKLVDILQQIHLKNLH